MATLVLTTLGTALGGPIGGALGSIVGQSIDRNLFGPPVRRGPRLGDLSVQTSSYGTPIPRIYGRMRIAGTVVWATDLREEEVISGGGKGAPGAIGYAYCASFAVALSSRRAHSIGRIWADGKLLRGADGAFTSKVTYRFRPGSEEQVVDPLIASIEGASGSPAFRGIALAVFEDMALADYGNRIPSLTFELIADESPPRVEAVISDISGNVIERGDDNRTFDGFAALGNDRRSALETLIDLWGGSYHDDGSTLRCALGNGSVMMIGDPQNSGCVLDDDAPVPRIEREQDAADSLPDALTIEYYDPDRDYQAGQMRATLATGGRSQRRIDSASVMGAGLAKSLASDALARRWAGRDQVRLRLAPSFMALKPGQVVAMADVPGRYRVEDVTLDGLVAVVVARRIPSGNSSLAGDPGRQTADPGLSIGRSVPILLDLPATGTSEADAFGLTLAMGCEGRFKPTVAKVEANAMPIAGLRINRAAITGRATSLLAAGPSTMIDSLNSLDVQLSHSQSLLYHADAAALAMGANEMAIGDEIIQFGRALALGGGAYRLSHLLRGRRGTEWAVAGHQGGERFVLLDPPSLVTVTMDRAMIGASVAVRAYGVADDAANPPVARLQANGESLRPMSPCHLDVAMEGASCILRWVARRAGSSWSTGPVEETAARAFGVTARRGTGARTWAAPSSPLILPVGDLLALGVGPIDIEVVEQGVLPSRPATLTFTI